MNRPLAALVVVIALISAGYDGNPAESAPIEDDRGWIDRGALVIEVAERITTSHPGPAWALSGCELADRLIDEAEAEGRLSSEFHWMVVGESNCRNDISNRWGPLCCHGALQIHQMFLNDARLRSLGLDHVVEQMEECGANTVADLRTDSFESWVTNICAAHVIYVEDARIFNRPGECAWQVYSKRYPGRCVKRG